MWWCCGKKGKEAPGCLYAKHETKEDEDEDDNEDKKKDKERQLKYMKCNCCKEIGHSIAECPRDPNIKTKEDPVDDLIRILEIQDNRVLYADTVVTTTHLLKKCVRVPKVYEDEFGNTTEDQINKERQFMQNQNVFNRGAMHFEDYNYEMFNKWILIDPNKISDDEREEEAASPDLKKMHTDSQSEEDMVGFSAPPGGLNKADDEEKKSVALTDKLLEVNVKDSYQHETLTVETESEKQEAIDMANELKKKEIEAKKAQEEIERKEREEEEKQRQ